MKKSTGFKNFGLIVLAISMCLSSGSMAHCAEPASAVEQKQAAEDAEIQKIQMIQEDLSSRERYEESREKIKQLDKKLKNKVNIDNIDKLMASQSDEINELNKKLDEKLGNLLIISEIMPQTKNGVVTSFNVETTEIGNWLLKTVYPKDRIPSKVRMAGPLDGAIVTGKGSYFAEAGDISLLNANSILRFSGKVKLKGVVFEGEKSDPLTFILLDMGFVYVTGKGKVTLNNGKSIVLPN